MSYAGVDFPTVEHAYQAAKSVDDEVLKVFSKLPKPGDAKRAGRYLKIRPDWDEFKLVVMECLVRQKFQNHQSLKDKLLATGDAYLEETNHWNDTFWGVCNGVGHNHLGKILMKIREEIQNGKEKVD